MQFRLFKPTQRLTRTTWSFFKASADLTANPAVKVASGLLLVINCSQNFFVFDPLNSHFRFPTSIAARRQRGPGAGPDVPAAARNHVALGGYDYEDLRLCTPGPLYGGLR